jgi:riboflavin synthase
MFTGIVEAVGKVMTIERGGQSARLTIAAGRVSEDVAIGDSVAVSGACLTVVEVRPPSLTFEALYETLRRTGLGQLQVGDTVNLERSLPVTGRFGGHIVQGHVDGTGRIASIRPIGDGWQVFVDVAPELMRTIVTKGSVTVDGISLTVAEAADRTFSIQVIPHTWDNTTLNERRAGDSVNIETDILGKYVEKLLGGAVPGGQRAPDGVSMDLLARAGYVAAATEEDAGW